MNKSKAKERSLTDPFFSGIIFVFCFYHNSSVYMITPGFTGRKSETLTVALGKIRLT